MIVPAPTRPSAIQLDHPAPGELDLFAFALLLLDNLRFIAACGVVAALAMIGYLLHVKPRFASTAVMVIPQGNTKASLLEAKIAANTADLLGGGYELYADILRSRTVADRLIQDYGLVEAYHCQDMPTAELQLAALTKVVSLPEGVLRVTVEDTDPRRAAGLANDYLHQLDLLNSQLVLTSIGQERAYLEREMVAEKDRLADAEVALKEVEESTSGVAPDVEAKGSLTALDTTRALLRATQVKLGALLQSETDNNPEVIRTRAEIATLASQLNALQSGSISAMTGTPTSRVPEEALVYARRLREVKFHELLFDSLEKQFEAAKQQEAKTPSVVEVLDPGIPALRKSWPPRTTYTLLAGIVGLVVGVLLTILWAIVLNFLSAAPNAGKIQQIKATCFRQFGIKT
jgi:tyrosine-protein kinase Etk/Wzc